MPDVYHILIKVMGTILVIYDVVFFGGIGRSGGDG